MLHGIPDPLVLRLGVSQFLDNDFVQILLPQSMGATVFLTVANISAAPIFDSLAVLVSDRLGCEGTTAVTADDETGVTVDGISLASSDVILFPKRQQLLNLFP